MKVDRLPTTLAHDLGLKETEFTSMILIEADSHEKIREVRFFSPLTPSFVF